MPELPEVETIKLGLQKYLVGKKIENVDLLSSKQFFGDSKDVEGATITSVERFGKGLVINLNNGYSLAIHIKLTGQLIYQGPDVPKNVHVSKAKVGTLPNKFTHIIFHLDHDATLYFNDVRQFGWIKVVKTNAVKDLPFFKELGPEFLVRSTSGHKGMTEDMFAKILSQARQPVKVVIMDQKKMAGVGNIYANDALYLAGIDPRRAANSLSPEEVKKLYKAILTVLQKGLQEGGSSELTYVNALGEEGNYQNHTLIYGREGQTCDSGKGIVKKFMLGGRGTYMCPQCQK